MSAVRGLEAATTHGPGRRPVYRAAVEPPVRGSGARRWLWQHRGPLTDGWLKRRLEARQSLTGHGSVGSQQQHPPAWRCRRDGFQVRRAVVA